MNINYEYYKIFYYAAKNRSFSRTAKVLLTNQPNITRVIKILEGELGCTLFNRMKNGVTLTPEGEILYEHISKAVELITEGEDEISKANDLQSGTVTISVTETALHGVMLPLLNEFHERYPGIKIAAEPFNPSGTDCSQKRHCKPRCGNNADKHRGLAEFS